MKRTTYLIALLALISIGIAKAGVVITDQYKFLFDGVATSTVPSSPAITATLYGSTNATYNMFGIANGGCALNAGSNVLFSGGGAGWRGSVMYNLNGNTALVTNKKEVLEFDWNPATTASDAMAYNAIGISDAAKNPIFVLVTELWSASNSGIHLMNLTPAKLAAAWYLNSATYTGTGDYKTDCVNEFAASWLGANFPNNKTYHVKAKLDFSTHMIDSITISRVDDPTLKYVGVNIAFLSASATNADKISAMANRGKNQTNSGNGSNSQMWMTVDNYSVYTWEVAAITSVTVNYYDADDNTFITSVVRGNQAIGGTYTATASDKTTFSFMGNLCVFSSATLDNVEITGDGLAYVNLKMKRYPETSATYTWTGLVDGTWNELNANFTTNGSNSLGFQSGNAVIFDATGNNKTITLNEQFNLGSNDLTISSDGYSISGSGMINGTGKVVLNTIADEIATLDFVNALNSVEVNGGTAYIKNGSGSATYTLADGAKIILETGAGFSKDITGTGAATIQTNSNVFYSPAITGPSTVNLILGVSGNLASVDWSSKVLTVMPSNALVNVTTNQANAGYGVASNSVQNSKLNLGDNVRLLFNYNPTEGGGTIIYAGELSGSASSSVEGGWVNSGTRGLNYHIGGLGSDATFNGVFKNYSTAPTAPLNIHKKGAGIWTLTGTSPDFILGTLKVDEGTVIMNGSLTGTAVPVTVASGAILKGNGTIAGAVTVNGTLEGSLNFSSPLTLSGITKFVVNGIGEGEYDAIDVAGTVNLGGEVDIIVNESAGVKGVSKAKSAHPVGTRIKLINATSIVTSLPTVHYAASGWTFIPASGEIVYDPMNVVSGMGSNNVEFRVYPTVAKDFVTVEGNVNAIEVINLAGQKVMSLKAEGTQTKVNLVNLSSGSYLLKAVMEDGSVNVQNVILQK